MPAHPRDEYCSWDDIGASRAAKLSDAQFKELTTPGTGLYNAWIKRLDTLSPFFQDPEKCVGSWYYSAPSMK